MTLTVDDGLPDGLRVHNSDADGVAQAFGLQDVALKIQYAHLLSPLPLLRLLPPTALLLLCAAAARHTWSSGNIQPVELVAAGAALEGVAVVESC